MKIFFTLALGIMTILPVTAQEKKILPAKAANAPQPWSITEINWDKQTEDSHIRQSSQFISLRGNRRYFATISFTTAHKLSESDIESIKIQVMQFYRDSDNPDLPNFTRASIKQQTDKHYLATIGFYVRHRYNEAFNNDKEHARRIKLEMIVPSTFAANITVARVTMTSPFDNKPLYIEPGYETIPMVTDELINYAKSRQAANFTIKGINGKSMMFKNDRAILPLIYAASTSSGDADNKVLKVGTYGNFASAGFPLCTAKVFLGASAPPIANRAIWTGKDEFNFSRLDNLVWRVLATNRDADIILYTFCDPYQSWGEENPEEVCLNEKGAKAIGFWHQTSWGAKVTDLAKDRLLPSIFSSRAKTDIIAAIEKMIEHIEKQPYRNAIAGIYVVGWEDGQMGNWSTATQGEVSVSLPDYSQAAKREFRNFIRKKYHNLGGLEQLRTDYKNPRLTFETIEIPPVADRLSSNNRSFFRPQDIPLLNYAEFNNSAKTFMADAICEAIKKKTNGRYLTGFYGGLPGIHQNFDITAKYNPGDGGRLPGYPLDLPLPYSSFALNNKMLIHEYDVRTICSPGVFPEDNFNVGKAKTEPEFMNSALKVAGLTAVRGQGLWALELGPGHNWFNHPTLMTGFGQMPKIFNYGLNDSSNSTADVAFVLDQRFYDVVSEHPTKLYRMYIAWYLGLNWPQSGLNYDFYFSHDLNNPAMPKYKVYFFLTPQTMTNNEIAAVEKLKNDNRLLVFVHAPGLYSGQKSVEATIEKISGFKVTKLEMVKYEGTWEQKITLPYLKNLQGFFDHETYSVSYVFNREGKNALLQGQGFAVVDRDAVKLGTYSAMPDKTMVALKDFGTWKSVFYGGLRPDVKFIRNVALLGGAFDYCSSYDALWFNRQLLVFHSLASGKKVLHLPYPTNVTDLVTGKIIGKRLTEINLDLPYGETLIFGLESDKK